jgi:hypothetical protein
MEKSPPLLQIVQQHQESKPSMTHVDKWDYHLIAVHPTQQNSHTCHQDCRVPIRRKKVSKSATHYTGSQSKFTSQHSKICGCKLHHNLNKDEVNIFDANDTSITITKGAILLGWRDTTTNLWCIPLVHMVLNLNTDTALSNQPPSEFLLYRPDPAEAVHSVYELKTQPELVRCLHAAVSR